MNQTGVDGDTGDRLRVLAEALYDGNKSDLARAMDMKPGSFSKYLRGKRRPGAAVLERLRRLGVNLNWVVVGTGPMLLASDAADEHEAPEAGGEESPTFTREGVTYHSIPFVQVRLHEDGRIQLSESGEREWVSQEAIRRQYGVAPDQLRGFRVSGTRMAPTIRPGDRVRTSLVDEGTPPETLPEGEAYVLFGPSGVLTSRLDRVGPDGDSAIVLRGDNPDLPDKRVEREQWDEHYRVLARVHEVLRPL